MTIKTNPNFWDCECKVCYINPKSKKKCIVCGADQEDMPDSRQNEIIAFNKEYNEHRIKNLS